MLKHISLFNVFENWSELPNTLYASITFIDRYIGNVIKGNKLCITKEWFKYIISDTEFLSSSCAISREFYRDSNVNISGALCNNSTSFCVNPFCGSVFTFPFISAISSKVHVIGIVSGLG